MSDKPDESPKNKLALDLIIAAADYEDVLKALWYARPWAVGEYLAYTVTSDEGPEYANAGFWTRGDSLRTVDLGFLGALKSIAHQLFDIQRRLDELEKKVLKT